MARDGVPAEPAARRQKDARRGANTNRFSGAADFVAYVIDAFLLAFMPICMGMERGTAASGSPV